MPKNDLFGLRREQRIFESKVREVFTPHKPIESVELFFGRQREVRKLIEQLNTPGQHALLYGDRGVGKSSLARVAAEVILQHLLPQSRLFISRCDSRTTFESAVMEAFSEAGGICHSVEEVTTHLEGGKASVNFQLVSGGVDSHRTESTKILREKEDIAPSVVARRLQDFRGLLLIDEADALSSEESKRKLAELIKLLSDSGATFKIIIVGVAESGEVLTAAHPSVHRCLKETKLGGMTDGELSEIITGGAKKVNLRFASDVVSSIVSLSAGYPHFTQLLALKCAEEAIASGRPEIKSEDLSRAMEDAVEDAEGTLRRVYREATRSHSTTMYRTILLSAANIGTTEFTAQALRRQIEMDTGEEITQPSLNNYFQRLVSDGTATILRRMAKGVYRFNDPRMPSYVKIASSSTKASDDTQCQPRIQGAGFPLPRTARSNSTARSSSWRRRRPSS